jgi:hypothetical protein
VSEQAWDRSDLETAIVSRQYLCEILRNGGLAHRAQLAEQTGWLATLIKQEGRPREAEILFQQAIELGQECLSPIGLSSLIGRYANLLHDIEDYRAASVLQWRALLARQPEVPPISFPPSPEDLYRVLERTETSAESRYGRTLLLANLTNCLKSSRHTELARIAWRSAADELQNALNQDSSAAHDHALREADRLLRHLDGQLDLNT